MEDRQEYEKFVSNVYTSIYSQPWWLDAICGKENWKPWLFKKGNTVLAAMPCYYEHRGSYLYITKAPLTQNNGIIFHYDGNAKIQARASFEEEVIDNAVRWIEEQKVDVYEQQYVHTFQNWQPFFWNGFSCITRYSYIIEDTSDLNTIRKNYSAKLRNDMKKGERNLYRIEEIDPDLFYREHEKIYKKQGLSCPFSYELWLRLYSVCKKLNAGIAICAYNKSACISSLAYLIWDEKYVYLLMGGAIPEHSSENTFCNLVHYGISLASKMGKGFDFEGSMIKRIAKAYRDYGGTPVPYFRIRKLYNPDIIKMEAEQEINKLNILK